jgi:hypothetical protein
LGQQEVPVALLRAFLVAFVLIVGVSVVDQPHFFSSSLSPQALGASGRLPECIAVCDSSVDCFEECEYPVEYGWVFTTCGEYEGGWQENMCNPDTQVGCSYLCATGDEYTSCVDGGASTTCGAYGEYPYCGNNVCDLDAGETMSSCSTDCPSTGGPPIPTTEQEALALLPFFEDLLAAAEDGGETVADLNRMWEVAHSYYGMSEAELGFDFENGEPDTACDGACSSPLFMTNMLVTAMNNCAFKNHLKDKAGEAALFMLLGWGSSNMAHHTTTGSVKAFFSSARNVVAAAGTAAVASYIFLRFLPCEILPT